MWEQKGRVERRRKWVSYFIIGRENKVAGMRLITLILWVLILYGIIRKFLSLTFDWRSQNTRFQNSLSKTHPGREYRWVWVYVCMCKIECMCLDKEKEVEDRRIGEIEEEMQRGKEGKTEERSKLPVTGEMCQAGTQAFQEPETGWQTNPWLYIYWSIAQCNNPIVCFCYSAIGNHQYCLSLEDLLSHQIVMNGLIILWFYYLIR